MEHAVKVLGMTDDSYRIGGYGVIFGGADLVGETFTKDTNYQLDLVPGKPMLYDHMLGPVKTALGIWDAAATKIDDVGVWFEGELSRAEQYSAYVDKVMALVHAKKIGLSSGTAEHMAVRDGKSIKSWPIIEVSLTPTPAEPRTIGTLELKALVDAIPDLGSALPEVAQESHGDSGKETEPAQVNIKIDVRGVNNMSDEQTTPVAPAVDTAALLEAIGSKIDEKMKPLADEVAAVKAFQVAQSKTPDNDPGVSVPAYLKNAPINRKYDDLDAEELAFAIANLAQAKADGHSRGGATDNAYKALAMRLDSDEVQKTKVGRKAFNDFNALGIKANELNYSTQANYGDEWVGVYYSGSVWESVRQATFVLGMLPSVEVPDGSESMKFALESTDPTWFTVAQATATDTNSLGRVTLTVPATKLGTAAQDLALGQIGASVNYTGILEEDSFVAFAAQLRAQMVASGAEILEQIILDGDTDISATTNINDIAGTPLASDIFMARNGMRKLALITNSANARDGGVLDENDFKETARLMGVGGRAAIDRSKVAFVIPNDVHWKSLEIPAIKTRDVFNGAVIESGVLTNIYGYPVYISGQFAKVTNGLTNSAGKSDLDTAGNNTKGSILAVRWDQWKFGWKRKMSLETVRIPRADTTELTSLMRFGLVYRVADDAAAISYNLTV